jgi:hypothetical protein
MAISTDRFRVTSIRPEAHLHTSEVPRDLRDRIEGRILTMEELQAMGAVVKASRLYHGGESLVDVYWHGREYVLHLRPVTEKR